ncbi:hypothetical protein ACKWTF_015911 [Chironomus riparius]
MFVRSFVRAKKNFLTRHRRELRWNQIIKELLTLSFTLILCPCNIEKVPKLDGKFNFKTIKILSIPFYQENEEYFEKILKVVLKNRNCFKELIVDGIADKTVSKMLNICTGFKHLQVHNLTLTDSQSPQRRPVTKKRKTENCEKQKEHRKFVNLLLRLAELKERSDQNVEVDEASNSVLFSNDLQNESLSSSFGLNDQNDHNNQILGTIQHPQSTSFNSFESQPSAPGQIWNELLPDLFDIDELDSTAQQHTEEASNELQEVDLKIQEMVQIQEVVDMLMEIDDEQQLSVLNSNDVQNPEGADSTGRNSASLDITGQNLDISHEIDQFFNQFDESNEDNQEDDDILLDNLPI